MNEGLIDLEELPTSNTNEIKEEPEDQALKNKNVDFFSLDPLKSLPSKQLMKKG